MPSSRGWQSIPINQELQNKKAVSVTLTLHTDSSSLLAASELAAPRGFAALRLICLAVEESKSRIRSRQMVEEENEQLLHSTEH